MTTFQTIRHIIESIEIFLRILFVKIIQVRFYQFKLKDFIKEFFQKFEFSHLKTYYYGSGIKQWKSFDKV